MEYVSKSPEETANISHIILDDVKGSVIALSGDLGSGKTVFAQGIGKKLGVSRPVTSPTFLLLKMYPANHARFKRLIHVDLYRVNSWEDIAELALPELWSDPASLFVIEWAERVIGHLPIDTVYVSIKLKNDGTRIIVTSNEPGLR